MYNFIRPRAFVIVPLSMMLLTATSPRTASAQTAQLGTLQAATTVLQEIQRMPAQSIPQGLLTKAKAVVIIPNMLKVGFIGAVRHGSGVAIVRNPNGTWGNPIFVAMTGGGVGFQVGIQSTDVILVFTSAESVGTMLHGRFTIGADAAAAAGPVGRQAAAATDLRFRAEILSYSRSRGLFVGVSLDGSVLSVDRQSNAIFYHVAGGDPGQIISVEGLPLPAAAVNLKTVLAMQSGAPVAGPRPVGIAVPPPRSAGPPTAMVPQAPTVAVVPPPTLQPSPQGPPPPATNPGPIGLPAATRVEPSATVPVAPPATAPSVPASPPITPAPQAAASPSAPTFRSAAVRTATPTTSAPAAKPTTTVPPSSAAAHTPLPQLAAAEVRDIQDLRSALLSMHDALAKRLDDRWRKYLALPVEVTNSDNRPTSESLVRTIQHFDTVAANPNYKIVADTPEFRDTHLMLKQYQAALSQ
ncbi:MAG: YSC84-related protein [Pirellulales bacterium]